MLVDYAQCFPKPAKGMLRAGFAAPAFQKKPLHDPVKYAIMKSHTCPVPAPHRKFADYPHKAQFCSHRSSARRVAKKDLSRRNLK